ncbi:MAG: hypothetical protein JXR12_09790 [Neptunomonas phycophila]|uniref:hypothetical protein n=1 Tax=Neptunomonas phycophila TaxID=1572645 RepID=UPI003B8AC29F
MKALRIVVLLTVLVFVGLNAYLSKIRTTDWQESLWVVVYPINADGTSLTDQYIASLNQDTFNDIEAFFDREAKRYRLGLDKPVRVFLSDELHAQPPEPPIKPSILDNILWSLQMRFWSWSKDNWHGPAPDVRIYMRFFSPDNQPVLRHSLGLQKGLIGLVNAFADSEQQGQNNLIAAHELLHTVGASDKYDPKTNWPIWPDGYAEPTKEPLFPQSEAEIMGGRVQVSPSIALIPPSLSHAVIGSATAIEINWLSPEGQN